MILSNVDGIWEPTTDDENLYVFGISSQVKGLIKSRESYPNITVKMNPGDSFITGASINVTTQQDIPTGNAFVVGIYRTPSDLTEFVISPTVNIEGDGEGAIAYTKIDQTINNNNRSISEIVLVNGGENYTFANVSIVSSAGSGTGAIAQAQISPVSGHGSDVYTELGAKYASISKKFDTAQNESYKLPMTGSYLN
jgi:hypothetical protein